MKPRIKNAIQKIKKSRVWNKVQEKWLDRFEAQLIHETILTREDLDKPPFDEAGGYKRLNKVFDQQLDTVLKSINQNLYQDVG